METETQTVENARFATYTLGDRAQLSYPGTETALVQTDYPVNTPSLTKDYSAGIALLLVLLALSAAIVSARVFWGLVAEDGSR